MLTKRNAGSRVLHGPEEPAEIRASDIVRARDAWRHDAPRRWWGLVDAPRELPLAVPDLGDIAKDS